MINSVRIPNSIELINVTPLNPLISQCVIKVCYVGDEPNRNRSIITKEVAKQMANSLPGSPIVGCYNPAKGDFEEHNRILEVRDGKLEFTADTRPYGFVDLNAKVWFEKFTEDGIEREYLCTEGRLWTGQYPEAQRIIERGNNQSMELDENFLDASWAKDDKGKPQFFIINEAIISKLCILGEDVEPCFEGAQIKLEFSLGESLKTQMFSLIKEMKKILNEGGTSTVNTYSVEIGSSLWNAIWSYAANAYKINSVCEEEDQKFAILQQNEDGNFYRLNFSYDEENGFAPAELAEMPEDFTPSEEPQFDSAAVAEYQKSLEPVEEPEPEVEPVTYNLEEITEYVELRANYEDLAQKCADLEKELSAAVENVAALSAFKKQVEKKEKEAMIKSFYMLSDADKKDVIDNIDSYSLDDIEAKLSIICVRNKVNFSLDTEDKVEEPAPITYNLNDEAEDACVPAWIKAIQETAKNMN